MCGLNVTLSQTKATRDPQKNALPPVESVVSLDRVHDTYTYFLWNILRARRAASAAKAEGVSGGLANVALVKHRANRHITNHRPKPAPSKSQPNAGRAQALRNRLRTPRAGDPRACLWTSWTTFYGSVAALRRPRKSHRGGCHRRSRPRHQPAQLSHRRACVLWPSVRAHAQSCA